MSIKESLTNFKLIVSKGGTSIKLLMTSGGLAISKMNAVKNNLYLVIDLPSKGWTYPLESVLSTGKIKIKLPTGRDLALLSSQALQRKGTMILEFLSSLILLDFKYDDLLIGDKNYFMFMSRVLTYGKDYSALVECSKCGKISKHKFDLSKIKFKLTPKLFLYLRSVSSFLFLLPFSKKKVFFSLNDGKRLKIMLRRLNALKTPDMLILIRTAVLINLIDGKTLFNLIFAILKLLPSRDTLALRGQIQKLTPDINIDFQVLCEHCYVTLEVSIPLTGEFFWPSGN